MTSNQPAFTGRRDVRLSPASIQEMLDENVRLIHSLMAHQKCGAVKEASELQQVLHRNLIYLATIADRTAAHLNPNVPTSIQTSMHQGPSVGIPAGHVQSAAPPTLPHNVAPIPVPIPNQAMDCHSTVYPPTNSLSCPDPPPITSVGHPSIVNQPGQFYHSTQYLNFVNTTDVQSKEVEARHRPPNSVQP